MKLEQQQFKNDYEIEFLEREMKTEKDEQDKAD